MSQKNFWEEDISPQVAEDLKRLRSEQQRKIEEEKSRATQRWEEAPGDERLVPIIELFDKAAQHLKWPKVHFGNIELVRTRYETVAIKVRGGRRRFDAFINRKGGLDRDVLDENVRKFLFIFAENPIKWAALQGVRTGFCCFCGRELTHPASVSVGYGPICAQHWGLPWGEATFKNMPRTLEELEEME